MSTFVNHPTGWADPTVLEDVPVTTTAVVRHDDVTLADLPSLFDAGYQRVVAVTVALGVRLTGPALAVYEGDPAGTFSIEIGFPVERVFDETDAVRPSTLPGGRLAVSTHVGPYDSLPGAWESLMAFVSAQGLRPGDRMGEVYVTEPSPTTDPATLRTDLYVPVS